MKENEIEQISITTKKEKYEKYSKKGYMELSQIDEKDKQKALSKKRLNIFNVNISDENQRAVIFYNCNATSFKGSITKNKKVPNKKWYLIPKSNYSYDFRNLYLMNITGNLNSPLKIINVFKK